MNNEIALVLTLLVGITIGISATLIYFDWAYAPLVGFKRASDAHKKFEDEEWGGNK
jgi:hypothetical protein